MKVVHIAWGFAPLRVGGLIIYADHVMRAQQRRGHEVVYFCSGRQVPPLGESHLRKRTDPYGIRVYEVLNSPAFENTRPDVELDEDRCDAMFGHVLETERPDVIHVHELLGLPSSLLLVARQRGIPVVMTLHDYHLLCPVQKLYDADGNNCDRPLPGQMCPTCVRHDPRVLAEFRQSTITGEYLRLTGPLPRRAREAAVRGGRVAMAARRRLQPSAPPPPGGTVVEADDVPVAAPEAYDRRRVVNVERLKGVDLLLAPAAGVADVYVELGVDRERIQVLPHTVEHIAELSPRAMSAPPEPVRFATLNGAISKQKGAHVLAGAVRRLDDLGLTGAYELRVLGFADQAVRPELDRFGAKVLGAYAPGDLPKLLADVDVGIVPSAWREVFGFVGPEFLASGIPVIGNDRGGIPEYVRDGQSGWLNQSSTGEELGSIMASIIAEPQQILDRHRYVIEHRDDLVKTLERHVDELDAVYAGLIG